MYLDNSKMKVVMQEIEFMIQENKISSALLQQIKTQQFEILGGYQKQFPMSVDGTNYIGQPLTIENKSYYTGIYDFYFAERDGILSEYDPKISDMYKLEVFEGNMYSEFSLNTETKTIIPIMINKKT